ncbi:MAG: mechanosensitive ion channel protein MscS [Betaproteobacteria bacterium RIFCSPLOWO2_02_64_14]|nr:MAG: mechanosensitive ion channel protein MscS [Betaproteobacteria bacterium RIFCSPLOWO2_02_64_14]
MDDNFAALDQVKSTAIDLGMKFGPKLLVAIVIMTVGFLVARWVAGVVVHMLRRFEFEAPVRQLLVSITRALVLILFGIMALQNLGVELVPLIAGLGVAGAGVALAMQGVLGNMVAGLTIILTRPFRVGEYISIAKEEGQVEDISLFHTSLTHPDLSRVVIPNRRIVGEVLHNYGQIRQVEVIVRVAYDADLNQVLATIHEMLQASARALKDPAPLIQVIRLADSSVNIAVKPWVNVPDYVAATGEINKALVETFRGRNIVIPFPQQEVRLLGSAA